MLLQFRQYLNAIRHHASAIYKQSFCNNIIQLLIVEPPQFLTLAHPALRKKIVRAQLKPTLDQFFDIIIRFKNIPQNSVHTTSGTPPPTLRRRAISITRCKNRKCVTCTHLNCSSYFTSTVTNQSYPIRYAATCTSSNIIYLIMCTKCKKQYVGLTTTQLNTRINHHFCIHFNFPDHRISNISVQVIDKTHNNSLQELRQLEQYWIRTLKTLQPEGLNCSPGVLY